MITLDMSVKWVRVLGLQCAFSKLEGAVAPCSGDREHVWF